MHIYTEVDVFFAFSALNKTTPRRTKRTKNEWTDEMRKRIRKILKIGSQKAAKKTGSSDITQCIVYTFNLLDC